LLVCPHCQQEEDGSSSSDEEEWVDDGKLYCLCRQPFDGDTFMLACDRCEEWYHGDCVGVSEEQADEIGDWVCSACLTTPTVVSIKAVGDEQLVPCEVPRAELSAANEEEDGKLYCLCHQPFDGDVFMLACDRCEEW